MSFPCSASPGPLANMCMSTVPALANIAEAAVRIRSAIHRTPVMTCASLDNETGARAYFKCENFQRTGSFKFRGATNAVKNLSAADAAKGVATHSSGNHGAALAAAAKAEGVAAKIVVPENAATIKQENILLHGAELIHCEPNLQARETKLEEVVAATGCTVIPPYNDFDIIAGQGTASMELLEDTDSLDHLIAPVGGGGLLSGTAICAGESQPGIRIWGAEPEQADDAKKSLDAGRIIPANPNTIADGLQTSLGTLTFEVISKHVEDVLTVSEAEIIAAMRLVWHRLKIVIEPSAAVAVAALLVHPEKFSGQRVGIILTGGNVDLDKVATLFNC